MARILKPQAAFSDRLRLALGEETENAFASRCPEVSRPLLRKYLAGSEPGMAKVVALAAALGVSLEWLATGKGPMRPGDAETVVSAAPAGPLDEEALEAAIQAMEEFISEREMHIPPDKKAALIVTLYSMAVDEDAKTLAHSPSTIARLVRLAVGG